MQTSADAEENIKKDEDVYDTFVVISSTTNCFVN